MSYTNSSHVYLGVHENLLQKIFDQFYKKAPKLFNYATPDIIIRQNTNKKISCNGKELPPGNQFTELQYLPIPGVNSTYGLSWYIIINEFQIEFPQDDPQEILNKFKNKYGTTSATYKSLDVLKAYISNQTMLLRLKAKFGLADPFAYSFSAADPVKGESAKVEELREYHKKLSEDRDKKDKLFPSKPITDSLNCTELEIFCVLYLSKSKVKDKISLNLICTNIEIIDITPASLETQFETIFAALLNAQVIPQMSPFLSKLLLISMPVVSLKLTSESIRIGRINSTLDSPLFHDANFKVHWNIIS